MSKNKYKTVVRKLDPYSPPHLSLTLPLKPMLKGGEKRKFKVKVIAENMGPVRYLGVTISGRFNNI